MGGGTYVAVDDGAEVPLVDKDVPRVDVDVALVEVVDVAPDDVDGELWNISYIRRKSQGCWVTDVKFGALVGVTAVELLMSITLLVATSTLGLRYSSACVHHWYLKNRLTRQQLSRQIF